MEFNYQLVQQYQYIIQQCYVSVKNPKSKILYKTNQNRNGKIISWSEQEKFYTNIQEFYQFQFYDKQRIDEDDYVGFARFNFSQIEEPSKKQIKTININWKDCIEAGTLIIQIQYHQLRVKQTEPMVKRVTMADIMNTMIINDMKQKWKEISLAASHKIPLVENKQSNILSLQLSDSNVMSYRDSHPLGFSILVNDQKTRSEL